MKVSIWTSKIEREGKGYAKKCYTPERIINFLEEVDGLEIS
ncbi:unnamed protein product [marine sediment metagenome]|uniref:Uncharacterized protein n=1 Tax=marine sediment metagenome TaxID=412755 RepID=X0ZFG5_9ZZZZ